MKSPGPCPHCGGPTELAFTDYHCVADCVNELARAKAADAACPPEPDVDVGPWGADEDTMPMW
jgi:hypothetical protein